MKKLVRKPECKILCNGLNQRYKKRENFKKGFLLNKKV
jgi:hypothetical protein